MREYLLDSPMISIKIGGIDVVLGFQWLQSLVTMALNFQDIFMRFSLEGKEIELIGIQGKPYKVMSYNNMTKLLKRDTMVLIVLTRCSNIYSLYFNGYPKSYQQSFQGIWRDS
jgi:hypothetical protein